MGDPELSYPMPFYEFPNFLFDFTIGKVILVLNFVSYLVNYVVFVVVQLIADICLAVQLKRVVDAVKTIKI